MQETRAQWVERSTVATRKRLLGNPPENSNSPQKRHGTLSSTFNSTCCLKMLLKTGNGCFCTRSDEAMQPEKNRASNANRATEKARTGLEPVPSEFVCSFPTRETRIFKPDFNICRIKINSFSKRRWRSHPNRCVKHYGSTNSVF